MLLPVVGGLVKHANSGDCIDLAAMYIEDRVCVTRVAMTCPGSNSSREGEKQKM